MHSSMIGVPGARRPPVACGAVSTIVSFHAHPDDESIGTGGTLHRAVAAGHRVVLVLATRGERGEPTPGVLADGEALWERRLAETFESARILGAHRVEFLGYVDSGMMGEPTNDAPYAFWTAEVDQAANRLAAILREEDADILTVYDDFGGYGHPDHIQVHRVGVRAAELAGTPRVLEGTMNQDHIRRLTELVRRATEDAGGDAAGGATEELTAQLVEEEQTFGKPEALITHACDVSDLLEVKRASMRAHASQIAEDSWFLSMDEESFALAFGTEWFIETGRVRAEGEPFVTSIFGPPPGSAAGVG
jgi:LmbE family N-acetylglucosaminyl deacetylase